MNILAIGGSDPSSGAGIQSDIRAAAALGAHCFSVVTAITAQNSSRFFGAVPVSAVAIKNQLDSVLSDFTVDAVCIGMVYDSAAISRIHTALGRVRAPIVLDPVIRSTTGGVLLKKSALGALKRQLVPLARAVTPNVSEAEALSGVRIRDLDDLTEAGSRMSKMGAAGVIITGCGIEKGMVSDFVYEDGRYELVSAKKIPGQSHGGGCNYAVALAHSLSRGRGLVDSARFAKKFALDAMKYSQALGRGVRITSPKVDALLGDLADAVLKFQRIKNAASLIPEVQTNFAYASPKAASLEDVAGVSGRIVKAGDRVVVAGSIGYGGSRHVGTAILTLQEKFPSVRAAVNIRYDRMFLKRMHDAGYSVLSYDRKKEPRKSRIAENSTISWGISSAIRNARRAPDAVYHTGDVGKEPMIIVFGKSPADVLAKLKILDV